MPYVYGNARNAARLFTRAVNGWMHFGDSRCLQQDGYHARLWPGRFGGRYLGAQGFPNYGTPTYTTDTAVGFGTAGSVIGGGDSPVPGLEMVFNGTDGGAVGDAISNRMLDSADGVWWWARGAGIADWLAGHQALVRSIFLGTGAVDLGGLDVVLRPTATTATLGSATIPSNTTLGNIQVVDVACDLSALTPNTDVDVVLRVGNNLVINANQTKMPLGFVLKLADTIPHFWDGNFGVGGTRAVDWLNPAKVSQAGMVQFIDRAGFNVMHCTLGANEYVLATGITAAQYLVQLRQIVDVWGNGDEDVIWIFETPELMNEAGRAQLAEVSDACIALAEERPNVLCVDLYNQFNDPTANAPYSSDAIVHRNTAGKAFYGQAIIDDIRNYAATATDVNVVTVNSRDPASAVTIIFDGETAGGSTTTRVYLAQAYDAANTIGYIGAYVIVDGFIEVDGHALPRLIVGYGNPGSGASYVDIDPALPYDSPPEAGLATRIVVPTTGSWATGDDVSGNNTTLANAISNALAGASNITVLGTVSGQVIEVVRKDTYVGYGRDFEFTKVAGEPWPDDLTGWSITFTATRSPYNTATGTATGVASVTLAGVVTTATGTQVVTVSPGTTTTNALAIGLGSRGYNWDVTAINGTNRATLRQGVMNVRENQTA